MTWHTVSALISSNAPGLAFTFVAFIVGIGVLRNKKDLDALNDNNKWEAALNIRNIEITDLKSKLVEQQKNHDAEIVALQTQITALQLQVKTLLEKNDILAQTVTGRDILGIIAKEMEPIPGLFLPGGFIENVRANQEKTLKELAEIKQAMLKHPNVSNPKQREFVPKE